MSFKQLHSSEKINPLLKFLLEMGPLAIFFFFNYKGTFFIEKFESLKYFEKPIFLATAFFLLATIISFLISWHISKTIPIMPLFTLIFVLIFGSLTLWFHNDIFIKLKPTIINLFFSIILFLGVFLKKPFLAYVMQPALQLKDSAWHKLGSRFAIFFLILAALNEIIWRNFSTEFWASFKAFGTSTLTFIFLATQIPFILKNSIQDEEKIKNTDERL